LLINQFANQFVANQSIGNKDLSYLMSSKTSGASTLGTARKTKQKYQVLYENERGTCFFNKPKFSARSLLPTDYPHWSDAQGRFKSSKEEASLAKNTSDISRILVE
jgi:hypothetical protein